MSYKLIRENDEHWRSNLTGKKYSFVLEEAIKRRHAKEVKEEIKQNIVDSCFCVSVKPNTQTIREIGFNCPGDLILDNFGNWLAGLIRATSALQNTVSDRNFTLTDITNTSRSLGAYGLVTSTTDCNTFNATYAAANVLGTQLQLGSGNTAAARANYAIETAFGTAPESGRFSTSHASYGSGSVSFSGAVSAGGADTVREMALISAWTYHNGSNANGTVGYFALFHDILTPVVAFVAGDTLNASYSITL